MPENSDPPGNPLSALLGRPSESDESKKQKGKPKVEKPKSLDLMHAESGLPDLDAEIVKSPGPQPPFPVGMQVRYGGSRRLFAGWELSMILVPGMEFKIEEVVGRYSVVVTDVYGVRYDMLISDENKAEWSLVQR